jgi:hypothetical protein
LANSETDPQHAPLEHFRQRQEEAADILRGLSVSLQANPLTRHAASRVSTLATRTAEGRFTVAMLGAFSTGKTTLIDALLGQPLLPVGVHPCTAVLTEVRGGDARKVAVHALDGSTSHVDLDAFRAWYHLEGGEVSDPTAQSDRFAHVERAAITVESPLLTHGVVLVDTPGLDDDPARTARTLEALEDADAVLFVSAAPRCLGHLERSLLSSHVQPLGLTNLFLVVTMVDLLEQLSDDPEGARRGVYERARGVFGPLTVVDGADRFDDRAFFVDGRGALQARWDNDADAPRDPVDADKLDASGLAAFETALTRFLGEERGRARFTQVDATLDAIRRSLVQRRDLALATARTTAEELRTRHDALALELGELEATVDRVAAIADDFIDRQVRAVDEGYRRFLYETIDGLPEAIENARPGWFASVQLLTDAGRDTVAERLSDELDTWLQERQEIWRTQVETTLSSGIHELAAALGDEARRFDRLEAEVEGRFRGTSLPKVAETAEAPEPEALERWLSVALGTLLLSPGTAAAGWNEGMTAVVEGAASRVAARAALLLLGALTGPVGWAGILLYAVSDAVMLLRSGGRQMSQLRAHLADAARDATKTYESTTAEALEQEVRGVMAPLRSRVVEAVRAEVRSIQERLDGILEDREAAELRHDDLEDAWKAALRPIDEARGHLEELAR